MVPASFSVPSAHMRCERSEWRSRTLRSFTPQIRQAVRSFASVKRLKIITGVLLMYAQTTWGQCAPGIPGAGNPGCIPPTQPGSPYYQEQGSAPATPAAPAPVWADRWGAIALDGVSGRAGTTIGQESEKAAVATAMRQCDDNGGKGCEVLITFYNQCAAASQNVKGGSINASSAPTKAQAEAESQKHCSGTCQLVYSQCSNAERVH